MNKSRASKYFQLFLAFILAVGLFGPASAPTVAQAANLHPLLAQMAAESPEQMVTVIVQKAEASDQAEKLAARLGGAVTKDLHIINAFAAEMTAGAARELARSEAVRWVSLDAAVAEAGKPTPPPTTNPSNYFLDTLRVREVWAMGLQGQNIGIAIIDSGVARAKDFQVDPSKAKPTSRVAVQLVLNKNGSSGGDVYGHGTHVGGIAAGSGYLSNGAYAGIAPRANILSLRVSDDAGLSYESDVVSALQWVLDNRTNYNIRVVNLSLNSTVEQSYHTSPLDAAVEILWFNGIVVVASAGNKGPAGGYNTVNAAPANDPFIITIGASDEKGTADLSNDITTGYSAFGTTTDGFAKPDLIAPGTNIYSVLSSSASSWKTSYPDRTAYNGEYFRLSGTSMAAPMVTGAVALLLQDEPNLTPDQVKYRLKYASSTIPGSSSDIDPTTGQLRTYPYLNVYKAVTGITTQSANTGQQASQMLWSGSEPITWGSVNWNSVNWNSVNWNSVNWNSVNWNSVNWNSDYWER